MIGWITKRVLLYLFTFLNNLIVLGIAGLAMIKLLGVDPKIVYMGVVGFSAANYGVFIKLTSTELLKLAEIIKSKKDVSIIAVILNYLDFMLAVYVGFLIYGVSSVGLVVPLVWLSLEIYLADKGAWFLTPIGILLKALQFLKVDMKNYVLLGPPVTVLAFGKVQKSLR